MIWLERDREAAVATPAVVHADQVKPLRRCIYAGCRDFSGSPQTSDNADNLGIRETVRGGCRLRALAVARVVVALVRAIFLTMRYEDHAGTAVSPLGGMPLTFLALSHCRQVQDLTPLRGLPLTSLPVSMRERGRR